VQEGKESVQEAKPDEVLETVREKEAEEELQEGLLPPPLALALATSAEPFAAAALAAEGVHRPYRHGE
tara:strand:+ start:416 stop:619 length:204 start_codon:yes stop_codon:yes gene_type:complete